MLKLFNQDFSENSEADGCDKISMDDKKFIKIMDENVKLIDGHYQLPFPFKDQNLHIPNNKSLPSNVRSA